MSSIVRKRWSLTHSDGRMIAIMHAIKDGVDVVMWAELDARERLTRKGTVEFTPLSRVTPENEAAGLRHRFHGEGFRSQILGEEILRAIDAENPPVQDPVDLDSLRTEEEVYDDAERRDVENRLREEQEAASQEPDDEITGYLDHYIINGDHDSCPCEDGKGLQPTTE